MGDYRIAVPPLAARPEDIPLLVQRAALKCAGDAADRARVGADLILALIRAPLAGNVRDVERLVWEATKASPGKTIRPPPAWTEPPIKPIARAVARVEVAVDPDAPSEHVVVSGLGREPSRDAVIAALVEHDGNIAAAARSLCKERTAFYRLMKKHGIKNAI